MNSTALSDQFLIIWALKGPRKLVSVAKGIIRFGGYNQNVKSFHLR